MPPRPPRPKTTIFDSSDDTLGTIPGPIRVEVVDDVIWAAGGLRRHAAGWMKLAATLA